MCSLWFNDVFSYVFTQIWKKNWRRNHCQWILASYFLHRISSTFKCHVNLSISLKYRGLCINENDIDIVKDLVMSQPLELSHRFLLKEELDIQLNSRIDNRESWSVNISINMSTRAENTKNDKFHKRSFQPVFYWLDQILAVYLFSVDCNLDWRLFKTRSSYGPTYIIIYQLVICRHLSVL